MLTQEPVFKVTTNIVCSWKRHRETEGLSEDKLTRDMAEDTCERSAPLNPWDVTAGPLNPGTVGGLQRDWMQVGQRRQSTGLLVLAITISSSLGQGFEEISYLLWSHL